MEHRRTTQRRLLPVLAVASLTLGWNVSAEAASDVAAARTDAATPVANAMVDPSGRIVPLAAPDGAVDVIGATSPVTVTVNAATTASPCPEAKPLDADEARRLVAAIAKQEDFYPDFVLSVAKVESGYRSTALSAKGAYGLMQLMPATAQSYKVDLCKPAENVRGGVLLLRDLHAKYRNPFFILAAYNAGEVAVRRARGVPPVAETVRFVANVMNDFYDWPTLSAGKLPGRTAKPQTLEPAADTSSSASAEVATGTPQWSAGFVMHVE